MKLRVVPYSSAMTAQWNEFVAKSKNATFLFDRGYMDYHQDRFRDFSLAVFSEETMVCLLPANRVGETEIASHQGLTYGGFLLPREETLHGALASIESCLAHLETVGIESLYLKRLPRFYRALPDEEIDYAVFLTGASLVRRDCALVLDLSARLPLRKGKKHSAGRARRAGCVVAESRDFEKFWDEILQPRLLGRYGATPVHTASEIRQLAEKFPRHIRLFTAELSGRWQAGMVVFETTRVAHLQYSALSPEAQDSGALDCLAEWLIEDVYANKAFFDFGTCNEEEGRKLNHGLLRSKEGFGARTFVHDFYEVKTSSHRQLAALRQANGSHEST